MLSALSGIRWQLSAAIHELKVQLLVLFLHFVEYLPEPPHRVLWERMFIVRILLEDVHVDDGLAHGTHFCVPPTQALARGLTDDKVYSAEEVLRLE